MIPQAFIDKLRRGRYAEALNFYPYIHQKYGHFFDEALGGDYLIPLMVYEFSKTDFQEEDLFHFGNVFYLMNKYQLSQGFIDYCFTTLSGALTETLRLRGSKLASTISECKLQSREEIKAYVARAYEQKPPPTEGKSVSDKNRNHRLLQTETGVRSDRNTHKSAS